MINDALQHRAELVQTRIDLNSRDINVKSVRNSMLPDAAGLCVLWRLWVGGDINPAFNLRRRSELSASTRQRPRRRSERATSVGYSATLNQLVNSTAPDKGVGLSLNIPIRNRLAQSNQVRVATGISPGAGATASA